MPSLVDYVVSCLQKEGTDHDFYTLICDRPAVHLGDRASVKTCRTVTVLCDDRLLSTMAQHMFEPEYGGRRSCAKRLAAPIKHCSSILSRPGNYDYIFV